MKGDGEQQDRTRGAVSFNCRNHPMTYAYMTYVLQMRAPRGADSKRDATTNPNPDFIRPSNFTFLCHPRGHAGPQPSMGG
jgi:hypothetical protein